MLNPDARGKDGKYIYSKAKRVELRKTIKKATEKANAGALRTIDEMSILLRKLGVQGHAVIAKYQMYEPPTYRLKCMKIGFDAIRESIAAQMRYKEVPVDIVTFVTSPDYLNMPVKPHTDEPGEIYPAILEELKKACEKPYIEHVLTGGIGSAKTTVALILFAYTLYLVACLRNPHREYALIKSDEIVFVFQSLNAAHAKTVDYGRFKAMISNCKWFQKNFMYNKQIDSELQFPNRICVKPISGASTGAIGQNVIAALIDEINFMKITDKSKQSNDSGTYDQARENYNAITRRRESRFMKKGSLPGILCLVSSKRYPGEFTDQKIKEAKTNPNIWIYDKRTWEIHPPGKFIGEFFKIFIGDNSRRPRIVEKHDTIRDEDKKLLMDIPIEYLRSFQNDILGSMRDIAGISTLALQPFILDIEKVKACFSAEVLSILSEDSCDFTDGSELFIIPENIKRRGEPRFIHLDLAMTGDSAGVACGHVAGFMKLERDEGVFETLPIICLDFILKVLPPKNGEIEFSRIRSLIYKLTIAGLPVKWISADLFQSVDTLQLLQRKGYSVGVQSMDKTTAPYDITKDAFIDGRIHSPEQNDAYMEIISLERDLKKNKIDHGNQYGKDMSDAIAGVVYGLTMRREVWIKHGIPLTHIPSTIISKVNKNKNAIDQRDPTATGGDQND